MYRTAFAPSTVFYSSKGLTSSSLFSCPTHPSAFTGASSFVSHAKKRSAFFNGPSNFSAGKFSTIMSAGSQSPVIVCPGQGAQAVGMGKAWADISKNAKAIFDKADAYYGDRFGEKLSKIIFEGPKERLDKTDIAQPAIFVTSIASWEGIKETNPEYGSPAVTGGLSLGEYTALVLAGAVSFEDALELVALRGRAMQDAAEQSEGTMVALLGADEAYANECITKAIQGTSEILVAANFNAPGQVVLSGTKAACAKAAEIAKEDAKKAIILDVAGAFHSPLMQPAADRLKEALSKTVFKAPTVTVMSNVTGKPHDTDPESIRTRLYEQLTQSVRWENCLMFLKDSDKFSGNPWVELAPGKTLSGMIKKIDRRFPVANFDIPASSE